MVPDEGIEPPTFGLQNRCSTAELIRRSVWIPHPFLLFHSFFKKMYTELKSALLPQMRGIKMNIPYILRFLNGHAIVDALLMELNMKKIPALIALITCAVFTLPSSASAHRYDETGRRMAKKHPHVIQHRVAQYPQQTYWTFSQTGRVMTDTRISDSAYQLPVCHRHRTPIYNQWGDLVNVRQTRVCR